MLVSSKAHKRRQLWTLAQASVAAAEQRRPAVARDPP